MIRLGRMIASSLLLALVCACASTPDANRRAPQEPAVTNNEYTFDEATVMRNVEEFFGEGSKGLGKALEKAFADYGQPSAYILGEEVGGALVVGLRYGHGKLRMKSGATRKVYWQGPSIGFDTGGNASKTFMLVYNLRKIDTIFQRYPGIDGSLYFVGGVGMNYNQSGTITVAPIRLGVGWRLGINVGYLKITREKTIIPF